MVRFLQRLVKEDRITIDRGSAERPWNIIRIVNWHKWQGVEEPGEIGPRGTPPRNPWERGSRNTERTPEAPDLPRVYGRSADTGGTPGFGVSGTPPRNTPADSDFAAVVTGGEGGGSVLSGNSEVKDKTLQNEGREGGRGGVGERAEGGENGGNGRAVLPIGESVHRFTRTVPHLKVEDPEDLANLILRDYLEEGEDWLRNELREVWRWCSRNPDKAKRYRRVKRFLLGWLQRAAGAKHSGRPVFKNGSGTVPEHGPRWRDTKAKVAGFDARAEVAGE